jgi:hypothetical protein
VSGKRQANFVGEVSQIVDGVLKSEILEVLSGQVGERCGGAPVAVLQNNGGSSDLLSDDTSGAVSAEIAGISCGVDFTGCEEDDWRAWIAVSVISAHGGIIRTRQKRPADAREIEQW